MKLIIFTQILFLSISLLNAQNLVPNGSFEDYTSCPNDHSQLDLAAPWFTTSFGSSDFYHSCSNSDPNSWVGVPSNHLGYQMPRTGEAYAGIIVYCSDYTVVREYITVPLVSALIAGEAYYFEMFVNKPSYSDFASDAIGVHFSNGPITYSYDWILPFTAQVSNPVGNILTDTLNWVSVSGIYTATGGEDHLTIGGFAENDNTNLIEYLPVIEYANMSYYYIDDVLLIPMPEEFTVTATDSSICAGETAQISANVTFGMPPYTYAWSGTLPETSGPHNVSPSETTDYVVTVTDTEGNVAIDTATVIVLDPPVVFLGNDTAICTDNTSFMLDAGNPESTYLWNDNNTNQTLWISSTGIYSVTVTDGNNCKTVDELNVSLGTLGTSVNITDVSCYGFSDGAIDLIVTSGLSPYSYTWNNLEITENINSLFAGDYSVTVTDSLGCENQETFTVNEPSLLTVEVQITNLDCYQDNSGGINITASGGNGNYTYAWSNNQTSEDLINLASGTFTVSVSDINNCSITKTILVNQPTPMVTNITATNILCYYDEDGTADLVVSGGTPSYTYLWSNGATSQDLNNLSEQTYTVTVTDANACIIIDEVAILIEGLPMTVNSQTTDLLCYGDQDAEVQLTVNGGLQPYTYHWNTEESTDNISNLEEGNYSVTITDYNNCFLIKEFVVDQPTQVNIALPEDFFVCEDFPNTIVPSVTGGLAPYTYHWNTNELTEQITVSPEQNTVYVLNITDQNNCNTSDSIELKIFPELEFYSSVDKDTVCSGQSVIFGATATGGQAPYNFYLNNQAIGFPTVLFPQNNQNYTLTVQDQCNNKIEDVYTLYNYPLPGIAFVADKTAGCQPLEVHFSNQANCDNCSYLWEFTNDQDYFNISQDSASSQTFNQSGIYHISCTISNKYGCGNSFIKYNMVTVFPIPEADFMVEQEQVSTLSPIVNLNNYSEGAADYYWNFGDGKNSTLTNPDHKYEEAGRYEVELIAISRHNCRDATSRMVFIEDELSFYAPTAFSPDQDGDNDYFRVFGSGIDETNFELQVIDRWGEPIFESNRIDRGWNGKAKQGTDSAQNGAYVWICIFKDMNGKLYEKTGTVVLIR